MASGWGGRWDSAGPEDSVDLEVRVDWAVVPMPPGAFLERVDRKVDLEGGAVVRVAVPADLAGSGGGGPVGGPGGVGGYGGGRGGRWVFGGGAFGVPGGWGGRGGRGGGGRQG